jgi:hypothetical protein
MIRVRLGMTGFRRFGWSDDEAEKRAGLNGKARPYNGNGHVKVRGKVNGEEGSLTLRGGFGMTA